MRFATLQGWLGWLESCHPKDIELGLDRIGLVAGRLSIHFDKTRVVTVAGTNGKGSCVATLNGLISAAGCRIGCFTSPHFLRYNERILIDSQPVDDSSLINAFQKIDDSRGDTPLTYFEFGTLAALLLFMDSNLDVIVLEVGLGGRLDAVNIIDPDIAIITSIAVDHQDWLGDDREQIGAEKAGILRSGIPLICADPSPPTSIKDAAERLATQNFFIETDFGIQSTGQQHCWYGKTATHDKLILRDIPLPGLPLGSVAAAIQACQLLAIPIANDQCLAQIHLAGRFQEIQLQGRRVILDVAHNPAAAAYLANRLQSTPCIGNTFALTAMMSDKDGRGIVAALKSSMVGWYLADLEGVSRALAVEGMAGLLLQQGITNFTVKDNIPEACAEVLSVMKPEDRLVVFGSFHTVAEVMQYQLSLS